MLDRRTLNRTLLARQHLLERAPLSTTEMLEHLVGMQAQVPTSPYAGLWSRVDGFVTDDLAALIRDRRAVRLALMRSTIHLVTVADALAIRPVLAVMLAKDPYVRGIERAAFEPVARALVDDAPRTPKELGALLVERYPEHTSESLLHAARAFLPLVQVPPRGVWGVGGQVRLTTLEAWTGEQPRGVDVDALVVRYLRAFGPATVKDFSAWSRLTGVRAAFERLRPQLVTDRDEDGAELFDVEGAPRADADVDAPVRFLPEYDNVLLGHADRRRILDDRARAFLSKENGYWPFVLVDGVPAATWALRDGVITVEPFDELTTSRRADVLDEGHRLATALGASDVVLA